jgi:hypothetical protein
MHITTQIVEGLKAYKKTHNMTHADMGRCLKMSPQNFGRILAGQTKSINDDSGALALALLGMTEEDVITSRRPGKLNIIQVVYEGGAMEPTVQPGDPLFCIRTAIQEIDDGELVVASFMDDKAQRQTACRYAFKKGEQLLLSPELNSGKSYSPFMSKVEWIAVVLSPKTRIRVKG